MIFFGNLNSMTICVVEFPKVDRFLATRKLLNFVNRHGVSSKIGYHFRKNVFQQFKLTKNVLLKLYFYLILIKKEFGSLTLKVR